MVWTHRSRGRWWVATRGTSALSPQLGHRSLKTEKLRPPPGDSLLPCRTAAISHSMVNVNAQQQDRGHGWPRDVDVTWHQEQGLGLCGAPRPSGERACRTQVLRGECGLQAMNGHLPHALVCSQERQCGRHLCVPKPVPHGGVRGGACGTVRSQWCSLWVWISSVPQGRVLKSWSPVWGLAGGLGLVGHALEGAGPGPSSSSLSPGHLPLRALPPGCTVPPQATATASSAALKPPEL